MVVMFLTTSAFSIVSTVLRPRPGTIVDYSWKHLDRTNSFAVETFIKQNLKSPHVGEAKEILRTLESSDWKRILSETDQSRKISELDLYLRMDPAVYPAA